MKLDDLRNCDKVVEMKSLGPVNSSYEYILAFIDSLDDIEEIDVIDEYETRHMITLKKLNSQNEWIFVYFNFDELDVKYEGLIRWFSGHQYREYEENVELPDGEYYNLFYLLDMFYEQNKKDSIEHYVEQHKGQKC